MGGGQAFRDVVLRLNRRNWPCSCQVMASSTPIVNRVSIAGSVARTQPTVWKVKLIGRMSKVVGNAELAPASRKLHSVIDFGAPGCIRSHSVILVIHGGGDREPQPVRTCQSPKRSVRASCFRDHATGRIVTTSSWRSPIEWL